MWARQERFLQNHGVWIDMPRAMKDRMPMLEIKMLDSAKKTPSGHRDLIFKDFTVCRLAPLVRVAEQNPPKDEPVETYMTGDAFDKKNISHYKSMLILFSQSLYFFQCSNSRFQWRVPDLQAPVWIIVLLVFTFLLIVQLHQLVSGYRVNKFTKPFTGARRILAVCANRSFLPTEQLCHPMTPI